MRYKTVIWDFNGTLLSDMGASIRAMNTVLSRRSLPLIPSLSAFQDVFGFPVEDYYERIGLDFSKEPFKVSADEWVELYSREMYNAPLTDGALKAILMLREAGIRQMILSASEKDRLINHLKILGIEEYFDEIHGAEDVYARGKSDIARELSERTELFPAVLIGDTDHDKDCADTVGCDCILFSGGFMSAKRLEATGVEVYSSLLDIAKKIIAAE